MEKVRGDVAAITQQAEAMDRERVLGTSHIIKLRRRINERKIEDFHIAAAKRNTVLLHKPWPFAAIEPGWDVVN